MRWKFSRLADAFWFVPMLLGVGALILAQVLITVDRALKDVDLGIWGVVLYRVGVSGGRDILGAIGGSMLAVAATSFSITVSVLATASSTYGPRLVRNFMNDRGNQFVLGIFGATFLYSLMVLRSIHSESELDKAFVPDIAVNVAVILAVLDVAVLVYFINHIARSIQVSTLSARVRSELVAVVDTLYPEQQPDDARPAPSPDARGGHIVSADSGFILDVDEQALVEVASEHDCIIEMILRPGDHVVAGEIVATVVPAERESAVTASVCREIAVGPTRTPHQDIQFAVQQLVEMAVRALSPSTNDPYTAHNALNELATGLVPMSRRPQPWLGRVDDAGELRLIVTRVSMVELIDDVFDAVRTYALDAPVAMTAAIMLARRIGVAAADDDVREAILRHLSLLDDAATKAGGDTANVTFLRGEIRTAGLAVRSP